MYGVAEGIEDLLLYAETQLGLGLEDKMRARNELCELLQVEPEEGGGKARPLSETLDALVDCAVERGLTDESARLRFETKVMGAVTPSPGLVAERFVRIMAESGSRAATDYLYGLSIKCGHIRAEDIRRNIIWDAKGDKGDIILTVNRSKPEKDPQQVMFERTFKGKKYPKCVLCLENIGFCGTPARAARQTLRAVPVALSDGSWHMQYSPYLYYDQHCIVLNDEHVPMRITLGTFRNLLAFVDLFPHYFLGSNADLPLVGGSIPTHDHYQGGSRVLPMFSSKIRKTHSPASAPVRIAVREWYNSVVSVSGPDKGAVAEKANEIFEKWTKYSDESVGIIAEDAEGRHNTVTPIATKTGGEFALDLILRNNRADSRRKYGIFHADPNYFNIKKEAIGLIEAMGMFILPGRLKAELYALMRELEKERPDLEKLFNDPVLSAHSNMFVQAMADSGAGLTPAEAQRAVLNQVNAICFKILENTAVFKNDSEGSAAFERFMRFVVQ